MLSQLFTDVLTMPTFHLHQCHVLRWANLLVFEVCCLPRHPEKRGQKRISFGRWVCAHLRRQSHLLYIPLLSIENSQHLYYGVRFADSTSFVLLPHLWKKLTMSAIDLSSDGDDILASSPLLVPPTSACEENTLNVEDCNSNMLVAELECFDFLFMMLTSQSCRHSSFQSCNASDHGRSCEQQDLLPIVSPATSGSEKYGSVKLFEPWFPNVNPEHPRARTWRTWTTQRRIVLWSCFLASSFVGLVNLTVAIWAWMHFEMTPDGVVELWHGDCTVVKRANSLAHVVINVLSTLLFGASNLTLQLLVAPTRQELDQAHARGTWLDIGVPSFRNLRSISRSRAILWSLLAMTSIPIHFL